MGSILFMDKEIIIGNLTTIVKILICIFAPTIAVYLGTDSNTAIALLTAIAGCLFGLIDTKFKSTYSNNSSPTISDNEELNPEYTSPEYEEEEDDQ